MQNVRAHGKICCADFAVSQPPRSGHFFAGHERFSDVRFLSSPSPTRSQAASCRTSANLSEASERPPARSCTAEEDCRLDAEKAARQLSERGRQMYELRHAGFEWREVAQKLNTTDAAARAEFSRELKRARMKIRNGVADKGRRARPEAPENNVE
jgi:hypothetical protein